jgi:cell division septation protein DedD
MRQLLTVIFILMVLFGVVFSMGYFVGRSSMPEAAAANAAPAPATADQAAGRPSAAGPLSQPAATAPAPEPGQTAAAPFVPPPEAAPRPTNPEPRAATPPPAAPPTAAEPAAGQTFLQVAAVRRPEAELIVDVLKKKGFPALTAPVPNESLFRVLVGPLADSAVLAKTKADLELAGFRSIIRKY